MAATGKNENTELDKLQILGQRISSCIAKCTGAARQKQTRVSSAKFDNFGCILTELETFLSEQPKIEESFEAVPEIGQFLSLLTDQATLCMNTDVKLFQTWLRCTLLLCSNVSTSRLEVKAKTWALSQLRKTLARDPHNGSICEKTGAEKAWMGQFLMREVARSLYTELGKCGLRGETQVCLVPQERLVTVTPGPRSVVSVQDSVRTVADCLLSLPNDAQVSTIWEQLIPLIQAPNSGEAVGIYSRLAEKQGVGCRLSPHTLCLLWSAYRPALESHILRLLETINTAQPMLQSCLKKVFEIDPLTGVCAENDGLYLTVIETLSSVLVHAADNDQVLQTLSALHQMVLCRRGKQAETDQAKCLLHPRLSIFHKLYNSRPADFSPLVSLHCLQEVVNHWPDVSSDPSLLFRLQVCLAQIDVWFYHSLTQCVSGNMEDVNTHCMFLCCYTWPLIGHRFDQRQVEIQQLVSKLRSAASEPILPQDVETHVQGRQLDDSLLQLTDQLLLTFLLQTACGRRNFRDIMSMVLKQSDGDGTAQLWLVLKSISLLRDDMASEPELQKIVQSLISSVRQSSGRHHDGNDGMDIDQCSDHFSLKVVQLAEDMF